MAFSIGLQIRCDTAANWTAANTVLALGEFGYETDTGKIKVGDGTTAWTALGYWTGGGAVGAHASQHAAAGSDPLTPAAIAAAALETPAAAAEVSGAAVAPDFAAARTLTWTLTGNVTSFALATHLPDQACAIHITLAGYTLPADPPSTALKGAWDVSGTYVDIIIEPRAGGGQSWRAESLEVVA